MGKGRLDSDPWTVEGMVFRLHLNGFHLIFFWIAFLLTGMWLGRQDVHSPKVRKIVFFGGIVFALVSCTPWLLIHYAPLLLRYVPLVLPSRPSLADISGSGIDFTIGDCSHYFTFLVYVEPSLCNHRREASC